MIQKFTSALLAIIFLFSATGCKKWRDNREPLTSEAHTLAEASFNDIIRYSLLATSPVGQLLTDSCFSISTSGSAFPQTVTVDFGNSGCVSLFGETMQGKIIITLTDSMHHVNAVASITTENLYVSKYLTEGTLAITCRGTNTSGNSEYSAEVLNGVVTSQAAKTGEDYTVSWACNYLFELIEVNNELLMVDDLYRISGSAAGVNREGRAFTAEITTPLKKYFNCRWPGSGITNIAPDDLDARDLDYGDCELNTNCCDNVAKEIVKWPDQTVRMK